MTFSKREIFADPQLLFFLVIAACLLAAAVLATVASDSAQLDRLKAMQNDARQYCHNAEFFSRNLELCESVGVRP